MAYFVIIPWRFSTVRSGYPEYFSSTLIDKLADPISHSAAQDCRLLPEIDMEQTG